MLSNFIYRTKKVLISAYQLIQYTMKKNATVTPETVRKGVLVIVGYVLFAACMQHDESLTPRKAVLLSENVKKQDAGTGSLMNRNFVAHLTSENEPPTNNIPVISQGQGQAIFQLSKDGTTLH